MARATRGVEEGSTAPTAQPLTGELLWPHAPGGRCQEMRRGGRGATEASQPPRLCRFVRQSGTRSVGTRREGTTSWKGVATDQPCDAAFTARQGHRGAVRQVTDSRRFGSRLLCFLGRPSRGRDSGRWPGRRRKVEVAGFERGTPVPFHDVDNIYCAMSFSAASARCTGLVGASREVAAVRKTDTPFYGHHGRFLRFFSQLHGYSSDRTFLIP